MYNSHLHPPKRFPHTFVEDIPPSNGPDADQLNIFHFFYGRSNILMEDSADITGLLHQPSVYLDNIPNSMTGSENIDITQKTPPSENGKLKPRKKGKQERAQRLAAEQAIWVRQKFDLPDTEQLIASFSAALVRSILLQGRIHITSTTICFYAKIFGRITKEAFPFAKLARVKKRRGGFVANAIKIYFLDDSVPPVVIGSLNHRERAFSIIQDRLREVNPGAAESRDGDEIASGASGASGASVGNSHSEERSIDGEDFHPADNENTNGSLLACYRVGETGSAHKARPTLQRAADVNFRVPGSDSSEPSSLKSSDIDPQPQLVNARLQPEVPPLVWRTMHDVIDRVYGKAYEKKTERARGVLHAPVKEVFNLLFVSDWLKHYHDSSNNRDVSFTDWYRGNDRFMEREVTFKKPLGYKIGPKETRVKETQRYSFTEEGGAIVELEGQNLDAPYGDYFVCESFFELIPQGEATTLLIASIAVHFHKSTILRGKIESGALAETKIAFQRLYDLASKRIEEHVSTNKSVRGGAQKRHTDNSHVTPVSPTKKLRSSQGTDIIIPSVNVNGPMSNVPTPVGEVMPKNLELVQPQTPKLTSPVPPAVQTRDTASTRTLRIAAISALITVCILLVTILLLLNKMRNDVSALEKLVAAAKAGDAAKCIASTCAADGTG